MPYLLNHCLQLTKIHYCPFHLSTVNSHTHLYLLINLFKADQGQDY